MLEEKMTIYDHWSAFSANHSIIQVSLLTSAFILEYIPEISLSFLLLTKSFCLLAFCSISFRMSSLLTESTGRYLSMVELHRNYWVTSIVSVRREKVAVSNFTSSDLLLPLIISKGTLSLPSFC